MEERRQCSIRIAKPLEVTYAAGCPPITARVEDISETGFFLDSTNMLQVGSMLDFALRLPGDGTLKTEETTVRGKGRVIWTQPTVGAGVEFIDLGQEARDHIRFFVASVHFGHLD